MSCVQPASAPYAKLHIWQAGATIPVIGAQLMDKFQILPDNYFVLFAYVGGSNYDNGPLQFKAENVNSGNEFLLGPARVPNNFEVLIQQDNNQKLMTAAMPQAAICSNGYMQGRQLPFPVIYKPLTTFQFTFTNVAPAILYDNADTPAPIDLVINFGFYGYNVPVENLAVFMASWPAYQEAARCHGGHWLKRFTNLDVY